MEQEQLPWKMCQTKFTPLFTNEVTPLGFHTLKQNLGCTHWSRHLVVQSLSVSNQPLGKTA